MHGYKINLLDEFLLKKKGKKSQRVKKKSYKQLSRVNHRADKHRAKTRALEQKVSSWPSHWSRSRVTLVFLFFPHFYIKSDNLLLFTNYSMALLRHTVFLLPSLSLSFSFPLLSRDFSFFFSFASIFYAHLLSIFYFNPLSFFTCQFYFYSPLSHLLFRLISLIPISIFLFCLFITNPFPTPLHFLLFSFFFPSYMCFLLTFAQYFLFFSLRTLPFCLSLSLSMKILSSSLL